MAVFASMSLSAVALGSLRRLSTRRCLIDGRPCHAHSLAGEVLCWSWRCLFLGCSGCSPRWSSLRTKTSFVGPCADFLWTRVLLNRKQGFVSTYLALGSLTNVALPQWVVESQDPRSFGVSSLAVTIVAPRGSRRFDRHYGSCFPVNPVFLSYKSRPLMSGRVWSVVFRLPVVLFLILVKKKFPVQSTFCVRVCYFCYVNPSK